MDKKVWIKVIKNDKAGFTIVELIVVMAVMGILSATLVSMVQSSGNLYKNAKDKSDYQNEARIALATIEGEIRRNDRSDAIEVVDASLISASNHDVLKISNVESSIYKWIYIDHNNYIYIAENTIDSFSIMTTKQITNFKMDSLNINQIDQTIDIQINYHSGKKLKTSITLRSE